MITDVLEFRLHPYAITLTAVRLGGRFLMPKALTTDIRALFASHLEHYRIAVSNNIAVTEMPAVRQHRVSN
ncbi:hypothetical protein CO662_36625 [Rhizobium anhuiense]|uniref:Uncharacterized protein n=1 Tax=Rhizobium anhuiense TaxID=1184720 RepID=A0ABX4IX47_9HYPH|nr:hypothetical protein CO668_18855 [Rhizobium anhuiense]PDS45766.1 hypothetical protein CO662_36625 [Rhizobium anhuiense]